MFTWGYDLAFDPWPNVATLGVAFSLSSLLAGVINFFFWVGYVSSVTGLNASAKLPFAPNRASRTRSRALAQSSAGTCRESFLSLRPLGPRSEDLADEGVHGMPRGLKGVLF